MALLALSFSFTAPARADVPKTARAAALPVALDKPVPDGLADLKAIQQQVELVLDKVIPCTVNILDRNGQGSGVIVTEDGYVLTAGHVSREAKRDVFVTLKDGRRLKAKTCGANHRVDSGLVKIVEPKPAAGWPHVEMGHSAELKKGQWVITTGHPGGFQPDRTPVVRVGRVLDATDTLIRSDCTIVGGDSGGPLFDMTGQVVGIHSRIAGPLTANIHVPVDAYRAAWDRLVRGEVWGNGYLGFSADRKGSNCRVVTVEKDSPADKGGLQVDDVITAFNGRKIASFDDFREAISEAPVHVELPMEIERGDETIELKLKVGTRTVSLPAGSMFIAKEVVVKNSPKVVHAFHDIANRAHESTVKVRCDGKDAVLGTVVGADGWVLTKFSELKGKTTTCQLADGRDLEAKLVGRDEAFDLAMLKVDAKGLTAVEWTPSKEAPVGSWLASAGPGSDPVAIGVVSVAVRKGNPKDPRLIDPDKSGFLGVSLSLAEGGVKIEQVTSGSGAATARLQVGDIILSADGKAVKDVPGLQAIIGGHKPNDKVKLKIRRGTEEKEITAKLGKRPPERVDIQNNMGEVKLSGRRFGFPTFLQHDTVLSPQNCGGPVVDLDGKVVGINIARAGRTESYAIPSEAVQPLLFDLMSGKLAPKEVTTAKALTAEQKVKDAKDALQRAEKEKDAAEQKVKDAKAALERAEADLKKEKEKESKTAK
jgi:serine protease Do